MMDNRSYLTLSSFFDEKFPDQISSIFTLSQMGNHGYKKPIISRKPSIQGEWHERIDLLDLDFTISHHK